MKRILFGVMLLPFVSGVAFAEETFPKYLTFFVKEHSKLVDDPALVRLRETALAGLRIGDQKALASVFSSEISIFQARPEPSNIKEDEFVFVKKVSRLALFSHLGSLTLAGASADQNALVRAGKFAFVGVLRGKDVGPNGKLGGQVCNRPVGIADENEFAKALSQTNSKISDWRVAKTDMAPDGISGETDSYEQPLRAGQMVLLTPDDHRDSAWTSVVDPATGKPLNYRHKPPFALKAPFFSKYVSQHVCFGKVSGEWKITAVALRF